MSKKPPEQSERRRGGGRSSLSTRLESVRHLNSSSVRRTTPIEPIADALVAAGYISLDKQARALGIHRATAWTIIKKKHKLGRLNANTADRMLANPELPSCVRNILERYKAEAPIFERCSKRQTSPASDSACEDK